jgi:hypothetical protein
MKFFLYLLILFFISPDCYSQDSISNQNKIEKNKYLNNANDNLSRIQLSENINHSGEINLKSNKQSIFEFIFPSLIALFVGGLAFLATIIATKRQLKSNKEALEKQINTSLEIAKLDFRKNVLSDNRQSWINELRQLISELISLINLNLIDLDNIKPEDTNRINFLIVKGEFMLNPIKDLEYINSIKNMENLIFDLSMEKITYENTQTKIEILKEYTRKTLKTEWERVKNGE